MAVDKSWIQSRRSSPEYFAGVEEFIKYATRHINYSDGKICCPCTKCKNRPTERHFPLEVHHHLLYVGIDKNYTFWYKHGEKENNDCSESGDSDNDSADNEATRFDQCDDMQGLIKEGYQQDPNEDAKKFYKLLEEAEEPLYPGCENYSNLSFVVNLMHIKSIGNMNNKGFDMLLALLKNTFPMCERLPTSNYRAKKIVKELGLHYEMIDACKNDCIIYYKEHENAIACPRCKVSRWKKKNIPWKVLRYFPITPRLQRLFMSSKTAPDMKWHPKDRVKDGVLRHPADAEAWKNFDQQHVSFANEDRNVRLGLATDGFNPFGNLSVSHSTWPVFLFPYNLPPWMCMKEPYIFMSLLIPGPKGPGKAIDVYLRPLIDEYVAHFMGRWCGNI